MIHHLKAQHLQKRYRSREVIKDISFEVQSNEIVGLLGPNGAGKTTCFYLMVGLTPAGGGSIHIDEHDVSCLPIHQRAQLGLSYLPQEVSIFRKLTAQDNILAILELNRSLTQQQRKHKLEQLLSELGITHLRHELGISLSGGERRRVEIARALATSPKFMLLDEPFAGVDPISIGDIKNIITYLKNAGIGVLITDHNVRETLDICQRAYIVNDGQIIAQGNPQGILEHELVRKTYLGQDFKL